MVVSHNLSAMNAQRQYGITNRSRAKSTEKLSSGYRINRAADDAAGLAISEKMRRQIRGLNQGAYNIQDGISMVQVADGALSEVHDMLNRMTELSVQAANGTMTTEDRSDIQSEITSLVNEIQRIADSTSFNDIRLFNDADYYDPLDQSITKLVHSPSADYGRLHEAYQSGSKYYPAAYVNFSGINASNIGKLNGGSFSFWCSQGCSEVFDITFTTDGTPSSAKNLGERQHHIYSVDISGCTSGEEIVNAICTYVGNNLPTMPPGYVSLKDGVRVSHSNNLIASGNSIVIAANEVGYSSIAKAESKFASASGTLAQITCSTIEAEHHDLFRPFGIQCSSNVPDTEEVLIYRMNTDALGITGLSVTTEGVARNAIDKVKAATDKISMQRSVLGSEQNRLEHTLNSNLNTAENMTAAESAIRDTDMAKESVRNTLLEILEQAGVSMMAQANQSNSSVLSLFK